MRGWSVQEVAGRLHLRPALVEALERNDYAPFGAATYARGQVRNYARLLGLDAQPLLESVQLAPGNGRGKRLRSAPELHPVRPRLVRMGGLAIAATLAVLGVLWAGAGRERPAPLPEPAPAPAVNPPPSTSQQSPPAPTTAPPAPDSSVVPSAVPPADLAPAAGESPPADAGPAVPSPAATADSNPVPTLVLRARAISWVEVTDRTGRRLMYELINPGSERTLSGEPPLRLLLGNAPAVDVLYNGAPVLLPAGQQVVSLALGQPSPAAPQAPQSPPPPASNP